MSSQAEQLAAKLEAHYRASGWQVERASDGTVRAHGWGGVTWIGLPVTANDLDDPEFLRHLLALSSERMPTGELCPLELLPSSDCAERLRHVLESIGLDERGHVEVYAVAA